MNAMNATEKLIRINTYLSHKNVGAALMQIDTGINKGRVLINKMMSQTGYNQIK